MVAFVLHTHLPYVLHHGTWPHGSDWLCEAVAECYLPLIAMCRRLMADGIRPGLTIGCSPILCEQLSHPDFPGLFDAYCRDHAALARGDMDHVDDERRSLAAHWASWYEQRGHDFGELAGRSVVGALRALQDEGAIEIMTCGATHGYLPLLAEDASVDLQVALAVASYRRHFGRSPRTMWLPECAYRPSYPWRTLLPVPAYSRATMRDGLEQVLRRHGIEAWITDEGAYRRAQPLGLMRDGVRVDLGRATADEARVFDERSPMDVVLVGGADHRDTVAVLTRHSQIALQVWSGQTGYPADPDYLDFHKKFYRSALRYWRITDVSGDMADKAVYVPAWATAAAERHARHFAEIIGVAVRHHRDRRGADAVLCLPFDTELFGHWWFEGPTFLEHVLRALHTSAAATPATVSDCVDRVRPTAVVALPESSWGRNGTDEVWMNPATHWMWEREYALEHRCRMFFEKHGMADADATMRRIVGAMMRQLLLAQASDWPFLVTMETAAEYATMRMHSHAAECEALADMAERYAVHGRLTADDRLRLDGVEARDTIFPEVLDVLGYPAPAA